MKISDFFENEFSDYANYDSYRSLGNLADGMKPTARKLICVTEQDNIKEPMKLSSLVNKMAESMEYLHGPVSAEGAAVNLAQNFPGSNNINLLKPVGSFGTRTIPKPAASRYIKTCKSSMFDYIFKAIDKPVLITQEFEGTKIEPKFYIPIIPMLLVNGNYGIGNGFAQHILSRNPLEIIDKLQDRITGKDRRSTPIHLLPFFKDFKGTIKRLEGFSYEIVGSFERTNTTTLTITELPIGYTLEQYNKILVKLEDEKIINDFTDKSEKNEFLFEVKVSREFSKKDDEYIFDKLKLIKRITENFTCIGERNQIKEFKSDMDILDAFIKLRLEYYVLRKDYQINKLQDELMTLGAKYYFIKNILNDTIIVNKKTKVEIEDQIRNNKTFPFYQFDDYNFLTSMPIHSLSKETFADLKKAIDVKKEMLDTIKKKPTEEMWLEELSELKSIIKKDMK